MKQVSQAVKAKVEKCIMLTAIPVILIAGYWIVENRPGHVEHKAHTMTVEYDAAD